MQSPGVSTDPKLYVSSGLTWCTCMLYCVMQEEMDLKVIQFKNKKLCERLEQRQAMEDELREKIEKLEKRQATDDTTLLIVNRYWSQVRPAKAVYWSQ